MIPYHITSKLCMLSKESETTEGSRKVSICSISPKFPNSIVYQKFPNIYHSSTGIYYDIVASLCTSLAAAKRALP